MSHAFTLLPNGKRRKLTPLDVADPGGPSEEQKSVTSSQEDDEFFLKGWEEEQSIVDWDKKSLRPGYEYEASSQGSESLENLNETSDRTGVWVATQNIWADGQDPPSLPSEEGDEDMKEDEDEDENDEISDDTDDTDNDDTDNEDSEGGEEGGWDDDDESDATSDDDATLVLAELTSDCGQCGG